MRVGLAVQWCRDGVICAPEDGWELRGKWENLRARRWNKGERTPENGNGAHVAERNALCPVKDRKTGAMAWKVG